MLSDDDYSAGYGKPPKHSRFKAGRSGNPKGRPKGSLNKRTLIDRIGKEKITIVENGRRRLVSRNEAITIAMVNRACKGDARAFSALMSYQLVVEQKAAQQSVGVLVVPAPVTLEEWLELYGADAQSAGGKKR